MSIFKQDLPFLDSTKNKFMLIGFLSLFIFIFLTVYAPFNMSQWDESHYMGYVGIGAGVLLLTQFVLRPIFGFNKINVSSLILLGLIEVLLITLGIYLAYSPPLDTVYDKLHEFYRTARYIVLTMVGPYLLFVWYLGLRHKFSSFKKFDSNSLSPTNTGNELLTITGENNKVLLALNYDQLLYVKSSGNYLDIYYLKGDTASKELVRVSLKELEAKITDSSIVRIHRSYMVNKHKISSFKKTRKGYSLLVQHAPEEILPVSLGYKDKFEEALELKASH